MMINNLLLLFVTLFLLPNYTLAQDAKNLTAIRAEVAAINKSAAKYTKTVKDVDGISVEGTEATYFVSGKNLRKISANIYGETYQATAELYYQGEELIFAFIKEYRYDIQSGLGRMPKVIKIEQKRFYFGDGQMIKLLIGKNNINLQNSRWDESKEQITDLSKKLKDAYSD